MNFQLSRFLVDNVNHIECYLVKNDKIGFNDVTQEKLDLLEFPICNNVKIREYHHNNLCYSYERHNDSQKVTKRMYYIEKIINNNKFQIMAFNEEVLPVHQFSCSSELSHISNIERISYKVSNRMNIIVDKDDEGLSYIYLKYHHSDNVDIKKISNDFEKCFKKLNKLYSIL